MLLPDRRLFFFHVPRCGGTAINRWLLRHKVIGKAALRDQGCDLVHLYGKLALGEVVIELDHLTWDHFEYLTAPFVQESFCKIAVLRDPEERALSVYSRMRARGDRRRLPPRALESFEAWCEEVAALAGEGLFERPLDPSDFPHAQVSHLLPQSHFVTDRAGRIRIDEPVALADLDRRWPALAARLGLPEAPLFDVAQTGRHSYRTDPDTAPRASRRARAILHDLYHQDYRLLEELF